MGKAVQVQLSHWSEIDMCLSNGRDWRREMFNATTQAQSGQGHIRQPIRPKRCDSSDSLHWIVDCDQRKKRSSQLESLTWHDLQPSHNVVILCFGSLGPFLAEQLREIAFGLERNGQRFLWIVQSPASMATLGLPDSNLDSRLLGEFLEQTKKQDLVVENWAPHVEVLSHDSVSEKLGSPYIYHLSLA
ncbi:UDP-glucuronosyl/UDP-glucosyltransferase [Trema orientale]|uniref:UDP-glucuronosyl/UDP-glucosyltransferase n=1 Tax=Trema orientale TaxID=63057 RepID=A0A2P5FFW0_TREOI|nr:UDP-glucuronosyl/UDP-glucosyltransferase [Trema orientale]